MTTQSSAPAVQGPNVTRNGGRSVHWGRLNRNGGHLIQACQAYADDASWRPTDAPVTCKSCLKIRAAVTR